MVQLVPAPTLRERAIEREFGVKVIGQAGDVGERLYAITRERVLIAP